MRQADDGLDDVEQFYLGVIIEPRLLGASPMGGSTELMVKLLESLNQDIQTLNIMRRLLLLRGATPECQGPETKKGRVERSAIERPPRPVCYAESVSTSPAL